MKFKTFKQALLILFCCYLPFSSMAWGALGHRIVGQIADSYLTAAAKKAITKILGTESIALASTWPDFIKSDTSFAYLNKWHYVNLKAGMSLQEVTDFLDKDTATDANTKINFLIKQLKNKQLTPTNKTMYLRLLIHIVGDVHQPLHVGREEDLGGNKIKISWFGAYSNLHRLWDEQLIGGQQLSFTEYTTAINFCTPVQKNLWQKQGVKVWLYESYQIVNKIYAYSDTTSGVKLDYGYEYNFKWISTVNAQLLKGGIRLSGILNKIFTV